jgi:hypothetical protein
MSINDLHDILVDDDLASFGDSLINFVYSIALSVVGGRFRGGRVKNRVLAEALCRCGLRGLLEGRVDVHVKGDAAEALIAYAWLSGRVSLNELVDILVGNISADSIGNFDCEVKAFSALLKHVLVRIFEG